MKINKKVLHFGLIMAEILILSICIYRTSKPEEFSQIFPYKSLESEEGLYLDSIGGEGGCYVDNSMDSRENCIRTPQILLAKGSYEISIRYDTVVNDQSYSFRSQNPTYRVLSGRERQPLEGNRKDIVLHVNYGEAVNGFQIQFNYSGNGYLAIHNVEITKTKEREKQQLLIVLFVVLIIECVYWWKEKEIWKRCSAEQKNIFLFGCGLLIMCSYPLFSPYLYDAHDLNFHLMRIEGIKDGLLSGVFPVRIQPSWLGGNGYAVSVFYGDLFLYFPAILRLLGFSLSFCYDLYVLGINVLTAVIAYYCAKEYSENRYIGFLGAAVYTLSPYRLTCVFVRGAVGEYTAMAFIPLVFYGLYCIAFKELTQKKFKNKWMLLVLGFTGIIQSHIITCEIIGILFLAICLLLWKKIIQKPRLITLFKAAIGSLVLNASFLIPFIDYMKIGGIQATEANTHSYIQSEGILGSQLFSIFPHAYGRTYGIVEGAKSDEMSLCIGLPFLIGITLCFLYYINGRKEDKQEYKRNVSILIISGILIFMSTIYFPWDWLADKGRLMGLMVENIQYPWRLLGIISFFLSLLICSILIIIYKNNALLAKRLMLLIGASAIVGGGGYFMSSLVEHNETLVIKDESQIDDYGIMGAEYLPLAVNASLLIPDSIDCEEFVKIAEYEKSGTNIKFNIINHSENPTNISLPLVYYRGYRATDIDTKTELQIISGENGRVTCIIPSAYSGRISVGFKEPVYWRIAETISFIGFICILFCYFYKRSNVHSGGNKSEYI